jgi:hypothetical protein
VLVFAMVGTAGATAGAMLHLGVVNTTTNPTTLTANAGGPALRLRNDGTGPALTLQVDSDRPVLAVGNPVRIPNLNADKLDGLSSEQLARGANVSVLANRLILSNGATDNGSGFVPLLTLPGFGVLAGVCGLDHHTGVIVWRNDTSSPIEVWHTMTADTRFQPLVARDTTIYTFASNREGGQMAGGQLALGRGGYGELARQTADVSLHVYRSATGAPCAVQATATIWSTP